MKQYLNQLAAIMATGELRGDRTKTGTRSIFGTQARYDISGENFPLVTTKRIYLRAIIHELLWFLKGDTNIKYLQDNKVKIWDEWADENGDLGPVYGKQWRSWALAEPVSGSDGPFGDPHAPPPCIDQIAQVIEDIKTSPNSRRHIVSAWNVADVEEMALPPCHLLFQFYVHKPGTPDAALSCQLYQRSADMFLGVPFNIASYALLTKMIAQVCGLKTKDFVHTIGDAHVYTNHFEQVQTQLKRLPYRNPRMVINPAVTSIDDFVYEDFELKAYTHHAKLDGEVAV